MGVEGSRVSRAAVITRKGPAMRVKRDNAPRPNGVMMGVVAWREDGGWRMNEEASRTGLLRASAARTSADAV